jgi:hypothetical protein
MHLFGTLSGMDENPLETLRRICFSFAETEERLSHGEPTWFAGGKKVFANYSNHHHDDRLAFWCAAPPGAQDVAVRTAPDRFFVPPYVGYRGWVGVYLDVEVDWEQVEEIVGDAWRMAAPKRLVALVAPPR